MLSLTDGRGGRRRGESYADDGPAIVVVCTNSTAVYLGMIVVGPATGINLQDGTTTTRSYTLSFMGRELGLGGSYEEGSLILGRRLVVLVKSLASHDTVYGMTSSCSSKTDRGAL